MNLRTVCINLEKRPERKQTMMNRTANFPLPVDFYPAVDGTALTVTPEIKKMFENNSFHWRLGIMGCALSHYYLWKELASGGHDAYLMLEDDTELHPNFNVLFSKVVETMKQNGIGFIFLGHHFSNYQNYDFVTGHPLRLIPLDKRRYGGGTGGYLISKETAASLVKWIDTHGCREPIDHELSNWNDTTHKIFVCEPHIVKNLIGGESDVQVDFPRANV